MNRRSATFAHAFCAAVAVRRWRFDVSVFHMRHVHSRDRRVVAERASQHIAHRIVNAVFHQSRPNTMRRRAVDLAFHNRRIDDRATVIHGGVVKNARNKSFPIDFNYRDVKLRGIGQGQVSVLLLFIGNLEWRPPDITAVQRDVIKFRRQGGAVGIHQICQAPVVDCLAIVFRANLRALRTHPELETIFCSLKRKCAQPLHLRFQLLRSAVNGR